MVYRKEDYVEKLAAYIKKNLSKGKGYTTESLKWALVGQGYSRTAVEKAIDVANKQLAAEAPKFEPKKEEKVEIVEPEVESQGFFQGLLRFFDRR